MKIAFISDGVPSTSLKGGDGQALIAANVLRHLAEMAEVHAAYFPASRVDPEIPSACASVTLLPLRSRAMGLIAPVAVWRLPSTFVRDNPAARKRVREITSKCDAALIIGAKAVPLARASACPAVIQHVDGWSTLLRARIASGGPQHRLFVPHLKMLERAERRSAAAMDLTVAPQDASKLARTLRRPVGFAPNGVRRIAVRPAPVRRRLVFLGSLDYWPNVAAVERLRTRIMPAVRTRAPELEFCVIGRNPGPELLKLATDGFRIVANAPSLEEELATARLGVFPDEHGTGTRNSVSELVCAGIPVVASPCAARNQPPGPHIRIASTDAEFVDDIVALADDARLGEVAAKMPAAAELYPDWKGSTAAYYELLASLAEPGNPARRSIGGESTVS